MAGKSSVSLSHGKKETANLVEKGGIVNFNIEKLYQDFKAACLDVISRAYQEPNKMNRGRVSITGIITF